MRTSFLVIVTVLVGAAACAPPINNTPVEQIPAIKSLSELMDAQATSADPQFKKIDAASYVDADFASFVDTGHKIDATSKHLKDFSKGPEFDAFALKLNEQANALAKAGEAKDAANSKAALTGMKGACKGCHSKFK